MSRREVRVLTLSAARLREDSVVWDVGAGTGSIAVEAALVARMGIVYAVEKDPVAAALVRENAARFGAGNLRLVEGWAPEAMEGLPTPDAVVVGGSGGRLRDILGFVGRSLSPGGRVVVNAVTLETLGLAAAALVEAGFDRREVSCINVARAEPAGQVNVWKALNPVYILAADKGER